MTTLIPKSSPKVSPYLLVLLCLCGRGAWAVEYQNFAQTPYGMTEGYTDNVDDELVSEPEEFVLMEKPESLSGPTLHERVFNTELSNEFRRRYQDQFGRTEQEENYFLISKQGYYQSPTGLTATQVDTQRRMFAEYMIKRLIEYHAEDLMKNDPVLRKIYDVKQAISTYNMAIGPSSHIDIRYNFIGNFVQASYTNPIANSYFTLNMDPQALTPTAPREALINFQKDLSTTVSSELGYYFFMKTSRALLSRRLSSDVSVNISETTPLFDAPASESITLVGLSVVF